MKIIVLLDQILTDLVQLSDCCCVISEVCCRRVRRHSFAVLLSPFHTHFANNSQANHNLNKSTQTASKHDFNSM